MESRETGRDLGRINAFSDGLFAIAATLLALSIRVPDVSDDDLPGQLHTLIGPTAAYFLSFAIVGLYWLRHHELFDHLRAADPRFRMLNLVFLSFVALIPVPTELIGRYGSLTAPVVIYAGFMIVLSGSLRLLTLHARTAGLFIGDAPPTRATRGDVVLGVFALSIPIAFVSPTAAMYSWGLIAVLGNLLRHRGR